MAKKAKLKKKAAPPAKRKRDKEGSKLALLQAAAEVFSERGYDAATTREVAKKAGVSEALIQRYFEGKAGLLYAVIENNVEIENHDPLTNAPLSDRLEDELALILGKQCEHFDQKKTFMRVAISRAIVDHTLGKKLGTEIYSRKVPYIESRLLHFQKTGAIPADADLNAIAFSVSALSFVLGFIGPEVFFLDRKRMTEITQLVAGYLAQGVAPKK
jgi:AcrR family transcriptional regulator